MTSNCWENEEEYDEDSCQEFIEEVPRERECVCGYYCMNCLGMSWKDFM